MSAARRSGCLSSSLILALLLCCAGAGPLVAAPYSGGDGTSNSPYLVSTPGDLVALLTAPADWDKWFVLTADLDLQATVVATRIGTKSLPFTGVFDGAGHSLKNLAINDTTLTSDPLGLFGVLGTPALIERLRFIAPTVKTGGPGSVGVLVGQTIKGATLQQCSVEQAVVSAPASDAAGSLVGDNGGTVRQCWATATVNALGLAGGLLGRSTGTAENCAANATVSTTKQGTGTAAGGISGASIAGIFRYCLGTGVSITSQRPAGLVGYADANTVFTACVCNEVAPKAVENWKADVAGAASRVDANSLRSAAFFTGLGWDLQKTWVMDAGGVLRLRWMTGGPTAVIKPPSGTIRPDPATGMAQVTLDGTQSTDPNGGMLQYRWQCLTADGGPTNIAIDAAASPTVSLPVGTFQIVLTVSNGAADSAPVSVIITVGAGASNSAPTAVIQGPTSAVQADPTTGMAQITLDGSQSSDPDKNPLTYRWKCLNADGTPTGIPIDAVVRPSVSLKVGVYKIELRVNDGKADSAPVYLTVTITAAPNTPPTAVAQGPSGLVRPDPATGLAKITLDGSQSSDPDKNPLTFSWKCLTATGAATGVTVSPVCTPTVSLPAGQYRFELTVNDGTASSTPAVVFVTVNTPPTAEAGGPLTVLDDGTGKCTVKLDGSKSSDPDKGQTLTYSWTCATATPTSVTGPTPSLTLPLGVHTVTLKVSDGLESSQDTTQVTVTTTLSAAKTAVSPNPIGRTSTTADVKFYLLLPTGKWVSNVDTTAAITLDSGGTSLTLTRDTTFGHKMCTVVAGTSRQKVLDLAGTTNGTLPVKIRVRLKTGETVSGAVNLQIVAGAGQSPAEVQADRAYYYLDTKTWK